MMNLSKISKELEFSCTESENRVTPHFNSARTMEYECFRTMLIEEGQGLEKVAES